ncbi:MAG: hypothetical protein AAF357_03215, partial [Verrucomicrobiota bacterium]
AVVTEFEESAEPAAAVAIETGAPDQTETMKTAEADVEGPLQLVCPKCDGDLVLMPEHIGVEGACVWCETKIVAARSGMDGEVRVFPLFQPDEAKPAAVEPVKEPFPQETSEAKEEVPQADDMVSRAKVDPAPSMLDSMPDTGFGEAPPVPATDKEETSDWSSGFDEPAKETASEVDAAPGAGFGEIPSGFGDTPEVNIEAPEKPESAEVPAEANAADEMPAGFDAGSPFSGDSAPSESDLPAPEKEQPEMPAGFGQPSGFDGTVPAVTPDEEAAPAKIEPDPATLAPEGFSNGFSADPFGEAMSAPKQEENPSSADPGPAPEYSEAWGAAPEADAQANDAPPSGFSETPFADAAPGAVETPEATASEVETGDEAAPGFSEPAPWGPPTAAEGEESVSAPAKEMLEAPAGFAAGFDEAPSKLETAEEGNEPLWASDEAPAPLWDESDAPKAEAAPAASEETASAFGSGFAIPASENDSFPSEVEAAPASDPDPIFSDEEKPQESAEDEIASWGDASAETESAPALESASTEAASVAEKGPQPAPPVEEKPQLFAESDKSNSGPSLFGAPAEASASGPPSLPETPANDAATAENKKAAGLFGAAPTVTSQPLGAKPAKKKGKGMIVMLVILLGLVCGAALASFVLPVDEYVSKARTFMEQKLNMATDVDPASFLSEMVTPDAAPEGFSAAPPAVATPEVPPMTPVLEGQAAPAAPAPTQAPGAQ